MLPSQIVHPWVHRLPVGLFFVVSALVHLGLSGLVLHVVTRPVQLTETTNVHAIELIPEKGAALAVLRPHHPKKPQLEVGRLGAPTGEETTVATLARSTDRGSAVGHGQPRPLAESLEAGDDTRELNTRIFSHPTIDLKRDRRPSRNVVLSRRRQQEEPTPIMIATAKASPSAPESVPRSRSGARPAPSATGRSGSGDRLTRIPLADTSARSRSSSPAELSRKLLTDLMDAARPQGRAAATGQGRGSPAGRWGASAGDNRDRFVWLSTHDRRYVDYFRRIYSKVNPLWLFPKRLEVLLEQGDVLVQFTILESGKVRNVSVRKSSGFKEFDRNVVAAIHKAAPFGPIPKGLGKRLKILAPFEFSNPMIR